MVLKDDKIDNKWYNLRLKGLYYKDIVVVSAVESPGCSFTCWVTIIKTTIIKIIIIPDYYPRVKLFLTVYYVGYSRAGWWKVFGCEKPSFYPEIEVEKVLGLST